MNHLSRYSRARFLTRVTMGILAALAARRAVWGAETVVNTHASFRWKGRANSKVKRWDIVTIGNLSRNRYWGESDAKGVRSAICTCTVIQGEDFRLIVDPSLAKADQMAAELDRRTGLKLRDLDAVYVTHEHGDHWYGLIHFPEAKWFAPPEVAAAINKTNKLPKPLQGATGRLFDAVDIVPTPGHTHSHHSLRFDCDGQSIAVAGDAVATRDFWRERRGYFNCVDFELSAHSMDKLSNLADIIIPGHDNYFVNAL